MCGFLLVKKSDRLPRQARDKHKERSTTNSKRGGVFFLFSFSQVYLNRPTRDSHVPVDVAVQFGSKHVASALAAHGARFLPRHLVEAQERGHAALAAFLEDLLAT
jgi:hypothetical protein